MLQSAFSKLNQRVTYRLVNGSRTINREDVSINWVTPQQVLASTRSETRNPFNGLLPCTVPTKPDITATDLGPLLKQLRNRVAGTPWFEQYCKDYMSSVVNSEHELFLHPVAILSVTTSDDPNQVATFNSMFENFKQQCPNWIDLNILRIYAIIHDETKVTLAGACEPEAELIRKKALQAFHDLRKTLAPARCHFLSFNSFTTPQAITVPPSVTSAFPNAGKFMNNSLFSDSDLESVSKMVSVTIVSNIIPHMQTTVESVHQDVLNQRSGIKHKWNMWFGGRAKKPGAPSDAPPLRYEFESLEFQQRRLGDWAYMLGDYWLAHRTYKSLTEVYRAEGSLIWEAGALEMQALSSMMMLTSSNFKEEEGLLDMATQNYFKAGATMHVKRCQIERVLLLTEWVKDRYRAAEYLALLADAESHPLPRAMFNEQSSINYLAVEKPLHRKYGFRMVMAAQNYGRLSSLDHSQRCLMNAYPIYKRQSWSAIDDHLFFSIARLSFILGNVEMSGEFMNKLLASNGQSPMTQNEYLREYLHIFGTALPELLKSKNKALSNGETNEETNEEPNDEVEEPIFEVPLLILDTKKVKLHLRDSNNNIAGSSEGNSFSWRDLSDDAMTITIPKEKRGVMSYLMQKSRTSQSFAIVGETIFVETELKNPLNIHLQFTEMRLICTHTRDGVTSGEGEAFVVEPCDTLLGPSSVKPVLFALRALKVGVINIIGIQFKLCGCVKGQRMFEVGKTKASTSRLSVTICGPMPFLKPSFLNWSPELKQGEIRPFTLRLTNQGSTAISCISVALSHPDCFSFPAESKPACEHLFDCIENLDADGEERTRLNLSAHVIPLDGVLEPSQHIDVPMWVRGNVPLGTSEFCFVFYYTPADPQSDQKFRNQRAYASVTIEPSLDIKTMVTPSQVAPHNYWIAVEIENLSSSLVSIPSLVTLSRHWSINSTSPEPEVTSSESQKGCWHVEPKQVLRLFLNASLHSKEDKEETVSVITANPWKKHVPISGYYSELSDGTWELPERLEWSSMWVPENSERAASTTLSDIPVFSFLNKELCIHGLQERKIKSKNLIPPPLSTYIDGGSDHTEEDRKKKIEEEQNVIKTEHMIRVIVNWTTDGSLENSARFGQINIREISVASAAMDADERQAPVVKRRVSLVTLMEAHEDLNLEKSPLMFTVQSTQHVENHEWDNGFYLLPVTIHVANTSSIYSMSFDFQTSSPGSPISGISSDGHSPFFWSGVTSFQGKNLAPKATTSFTVHAGLPAPGLYNINQFKFDARVVDQDGNREQKFTTFAGAQHLVEVT
eukprot:TRINITY_DN846_c0_g2_i1.p1 TRINITY_DN846_c0_g2~~TRINITY_DN846_c0_g2_i1.p1  ORF type:complete len:1354 (-),score=252.65 TRINITY_DN846_c0_g2_i1:101-3988(-)